MPTDYQAFIDVAFQQAQDSLSEGGVAAGAVLIKLDNLISTGCDRTRQLNDPIAVAEMDCIRNAGRRSDYAELTLISTRAPTLLVAGTALQFGIGKLVIAGFCDVTEGVQLLRERSVAVNFAVNS